MTYTMWHLGATDYWLEWTVRQSRLLLLVFVSFICTFSNSCLSLLLCLFFCSLLLAVFFFLVKCWTLSGIALENITGVEEFRADLFSCRSSLSRISWPVPHGEFFPHLPVLLDTVASNLMKLELYGSNMCQIRERPSSSQTTKMKALDCLHKEADARNAFKPHTGSPAQWGCIAVWTK